MIRRAAIAAALTGALIVGRGNAQSSSEELTRFSAVLSHIRSNYVDSVTYRQLVHAAIDGMLRGLDPHSWFLSSADNDRLNALERGELAVTGVSVELADGVPTIIAVTESFRPQGSTLARSRFALLAKRDPRRACCWSAARASIPTASACR
jgi:hypothetical protein